MTNSPNLLGEGQVDVKILSKGKEIDGTYKIVSIHVLRTVNQIPVARFSILDGDMPDGEFAASNSEVFLPGNEVEIQAGYESKTETIFKGIITRHEIRITSKNRGELVVECRDKAVKMTIARKNANFVDMTDSAIMSKLVGDAGLSADIKSTDTTYKELVQYYCTDWDFLLSRADANSHLVIVEDGKIISKPPDTSAGPVLDLKYGTDIMSFNAYMDARHQFAKVQGTSWDLAAQATISENVSPATLNQQGNLDTKTLSKTLGLPDFRIQAPAPLVKTGLKSYVAAQMQKSGLSRIRGKVRFQGNAKALPGVQLKLEKIGARFDGNLFLGRVSHDITAGNWVTTAEFGLDPDWFTEEKQILPPPASGLLPGIEGLQVGVVIQVNDDPEKEYKVKVKVPVMEAEKEGVWARIAKFYGSSGIGSWFMPEKDDEVVLGYFNNDPCHPVILGSLYSSKRKPPWEPEAENYIKGLVTRSKLKVEFDDENKVTTIETPAKNKIILSDKDKSILIQDENDNKIKLDPGGILAQSPKDIQIKATGKVTIEGTGGVDVKSPADITHKGLNITSTADVGITAKGNATAELSASGQTTVKGAIVMIN